MNVDIFGQPTTAQVFRQQTPGENTVRFPWGVHPKTILVVLNALPEDIARELSAQHQTGEEEDRTVFVQLRFGGGLAAAEVMHQTLLQLGFKSSIHDAPALLAEALPCAA